MKTTSRLPAVVPIEEYRTDNPFPMVFRRDRDFELYELIAEYAPYRHLRLVGNDIGTLFVRSTAIATEGLCPGYEFWHAVAVHKFMRDRKSDPP